MSSEDTRPVLLGWPALMTEEAACHYLSVDRVTFETEIQRHSVWPVMMSDGSPRWRKADLDNTVKRLPAAAHFGQAGRNLTSASIDDETAAKLAGLVARKFDGRTSAVGPMLVSIRDAGLMLGIGRTSIYRLIKSGKLSRHRIGSRTLIAREDIEHMLAE